MTKTLIAFLLVIGLLGQFGTGKYLKQTVNKDLEDDDRTDRMHKVKSRPPHHFSPNAEDADYWLSQGQSTLADKLGSKLTIEAEAKNVIFFLGDGMSLPTVTAARIFKGQREGAGFGEEASLFFESFPHTGISKTFCSDSQVADSACSATAYLSGTKANYNTIGVKPSVRLNDCVGMMNLDNRVDSALAWAQAAGKSTGVITTTRITHASPAGTYSHTANRDWENDNVVKSDGQDPEVCDDIAEQLIFGSPGQKINVILGGGRREFIPTTETDPETGKKGKRTDGQNLIDTWQQLKSDAGERAAYVSTRAEFEAIDPTEVDYLLGLFNHDHLDYAVDSSEDPSLPELVAKGIQILSRNPNGYFLFVEGGRIDHAHHDTNAMRALVETVVFDEAVQVAANMTSVDDTLMLVTSDHAHTMSISGYADRGSPILGIAELSDVDHLPYTILSYANGPGYKEPTADGGRYDISDDDIFNKEYLQATTLPVDSETHGGDDVAIFSRGPFSHLLTGVVMQSYIPHVIGYASCTGSGLNYCQGRSK